MTFKARSLPPRRSRPCVRLAAIAWLGVAAFPAVAHVAFSGYADFRLMPQATIRLDVPGSALGIASGSFEARGANFDAAGLFATTALSDQASFLLDVTYRDIGNTTKTVKLQYAYVEDAVSDGLKVEAGKFMLPIGYLNQNRFYSFQRPSVTPPTFVSAILGLPISDLGVAGEQTLTVGPVRTRLAAYAVNGYGPVPGTATDFRSLSLPGGITIANNLGSANANSKFAGGGRLVLSPASAADNELGGSYYADEWDATGHRFFTMINSHARVVVGPAEVLVEYLHLRVQGDDGMKPAFGDTNWYTDGGFAALEVHGLMAGGRSLTPWGRVEDYRSRGNTGEGAEHLRGYAAGAAWQALDSLALKAEIDQLIYGIPFPAVGHVGINELSYLLGLSISF